MTCRIDGKEFLVGSVLYDPPYWEDLRIPVTATTVGGANDPPFTKLVDTGAGSTGVYARKFSATSVQELFFWAQLPHAWKEGSAINPHLHWCPVNGNAGTVVWGLEYTIATPGAVLPLTLISTVADPCDNVALKHQIATLAPIIMTGNLISTMVGCRVFRDPLDARDDYGSQAALLEIDFHYQLDTPGSMLEYTK